MEMSDNERKPPPIDTRFDVNATFDLWRMGTSSSGNSTGDELRFDCNSSSVRYAGLSPPHVASRASGSMDSSSFGMSPREYIMSPSSAMEVGSPEIQMNYVGPMQVPTLGEPHHAVTTQNDIPFNYLNRNVTDTSSPVGGLQQMDHNKKTSIPTTVANVANLRPVDHCNSTTNLTAFAAPYPHHSRSSAQAPATSTPLKSDRTSCRLKMSHEKSRSPTRDTFYVKLELLKQYRLEHGHCDVPQDSKPLGAWVNKQRMEKKKLDKGQKTSMTPERKKLLEDAGLKWAEPKGQAAWDKRFSELVEFKRKHGHCVVPTKYKENTALGRWVTSQRYDKKNGTIPKKNEKKLKTMGFVWDRFDKKQT